MAAEASWQARNYERFGRAATSPFARVDQEPVERLLRRLIDRVEQLDRRYGDALEDLQAQIDHYSDAAETLPTSGSPEESDTLDRLRRQLSSLADRLGQPKETKSRIAGIETLNRVLAEATHETDEIARERSNSDPAFGFAPLFAERPSTWQSREPDREPSDADLDRRLSDIASRLERSINEAIPVSAIESLDWRMRDLGRRFDAALEQSPRLETMRHLESEISELGEQVSRVEQHATRIGFVEGELQRLMQHFEGTPAHLADVAREAAKEAARLVAGEDADGFKAAERLDTIHRDLVAMKDRSQATGMRMVDTLGAVHESLKALVQQLEGREQSSASNESPSAGQLGTPSLSSTSDGRTQFSFDHASLGGSLAQPEKSGEVPSSEAATDVEADQDGEQANEASSERPSIDDLVAAARRAAQAAAQQHGTIGLDGLSAIYTEGRARRRRSFLVFSVAILLLVGAAFLYVHFRPTLEAPLILPPLLERMLPSPAVQPAPESGLDNLPLTPLRAAQPAEAIPAVPVAPARTEEAPEDLPWRTETIPADEHPLALGQATFPHRD
jgi:hypothetical protein